MKNLIFSLLLLFAYSFCFAQPQNGGVQNNPVMDSVNFSQVGIIAINTDLAIMDFKQNRELSFTLSSIGTSGAITLQFSNAPDFTGQTVLRGLDALNNSSVTTITSTGNYVFAAPFRYVRIRLTTATTAGTTTFSAKMSTGSRGVVHVINNVGVTPSATTNLIGDVGMQYRATATGAASRTHLVTAATTNSTVVKAAAGRLIGWCVSNTTAAWKYVKLHNQATAPTAGTGVVQTIAVPPNSNVNIVLEGGIAFTTGIAMTVTNLSPDADATVVAVGDLVIDLFFL